MGNQTSGYSEIAMDEKVQNTAEKKQAAGLVLAPEREWPLRLAGSLAVLGIIALLAAVILTLKNDLVNKRLAEAWDEFYDWAGEQGFVLDDIIVSGRKKTTREEVAAALDLKRGDNILKTDLYELKQKLEQLPWVKEAEVRRSFFPNVLSINLKEKEVRAVWQISEKFYPLDDEGKIIDADFRATEPVLLIVGAGAPENMKNLLENLKGGDPSYLKRIKVANFISKRRWNLILDDIREGVTIKLPEENIAEAWNKLLKLNETKGILKRKLTIIDLRLPHKIVVKLRKSKPDEPLRLNSNAERNI